jgi:hypothetical protein
LPILSGEAEASGGKRKGGKMKRHQKVIDPKVGQYVRDRCGHVGAIESVQPSPTGGVAEVRYSDGNMRLISVLFLLVPTTGEVLSSDLWMRNCPKH